PVPVPPGSAVLARHIRRHHDVASRPTLPAALGDLGVSATFPLLLVPVVALGGPAPLAHPLVASLARRSAEDGSPMPPRVFPRPPHPPRGNRRPSTARTTAPDRVSDGCSVCGGDGRISDPGSQSSQMGCACEGGSRQLPAMPDAAHPEPADMHAPTPAALTKL